MTIGLYLVDVTGILLGDSDEIAEDVEKVVELVVEVRMAPLLVLIVESVVLVEVADAVDDVEEAVQIAVAGTC